MSWRLQHYFCLLPSIRSLRSRDEDPLGNMRSSLSKSSCNQSLGSSSTYSTVSPYLTPLGPFLLPECQVVKPAKGQSHKLPYCYLPIRVTHLLSYYLLIAVGTKTSLTLLIPGLPEPLAEVKYQLNDTLANLRGELVKDLQQVNQSKTVYHQVVQTIHLYL